MFFQNIKNSSIFILIFFIFSCSDSDNYNFSKDYYPVAINSEGVIYHWGKNNSVKINVNSEQITFSDNQSNYINSFKIGVSQWENSLAKLGITIEYVSQNADVNVRWVNGNTVSSGVLGYASTNKNITMTLTNNLTGENHLDSTVTFIAVHEFGHMLGIWSHSFDQEDIMYPLMTGPSSLSNRDKKTLSDFLYNLSPTIDMHDASGPIFHLNDPQQEIINSYFTTNGCLIYDFSKN